MLIFIILVVGLLLFYLIYTLLRIRKLIPRIRVSSPPLQDISIRIFNPTEDKNNGLRVTKIIEENEMKCIRSSLDESVYRG